METSLDQAPAFGSLLRHYRQQVGLTQEALAERAHLSARAIAALERGVNRAPRPDTLQLLADALGLVGPERAGLEAAARLSRPLAPVPPGPTRRSSAGPASPDGTLGGPLPPLVGRTDELALLERQLAGQGPPLLLLAGEPGIGKTRLLQEAARQAPGSGWMVLAGGCQRRGGQEPYAPLVETLEAHLQRLEAAARRAALHGCAWLVRLLPELAAGPIEPLPAWAVAPAQERRLLFRAVGRYLANVAGPAGTLLLLDDLQWAGPDALDLLASVVRAAAAGGGPLLRMVGAYRDSEVHSQDPLALLLSDLGRAGLATRRLVPPLPPPEAAHLLAGLLPEGSAEHEDVWTRVVQRTGGVPFYLVSYAQCLRTREPESGGEEGAPWDVAQSIRQRVAALPERARAVLGVAAVLGREVPTLLLAAAAARTEEDVVTALEAACQGQLLVEDARGTRFAHDIIREVVEADLGAARRRLLHRRVAAAIEALHAQRLPESYELLAHHYTEAGLVAEAAPRWLQAGQRAAQRSAYREAISHLAQGLALVPLLPDTPARPQQELELQVALGQALIVLLGNTAPEVEQAYRRARELCRQVGAAAPLVPVLRGLWQLYWMRGASQTARELAGEVLAAADGQDDEQLLVAHYICGNTRLWLGELAAARAHLEESLARYETWSDPQRTPSPMLTHWLDSGVTSLGYLAWLLWLQGKADAALTRHDASLQLAQRRGHPYSLAYGLVLAAFVRQCCGDVQAALDEADRGVALATDQGFPLLRAWGQAVRGWALAARGDADQGIALLGEGIATLRATGAELAVPYFLSLLGDACMRAGRADAALAAVAEGLTVADATDQRLFSAELHRLRGEVLRGRDAGPAEHSLTQALAIARAQGAHALELRAALSLGCLWHDQGRFTAARVLLAESYGWFTEGFATADLQAARALLAELDRAPASPSGGRA